MVKPKRKYKKRQAKEPKTAANEEPDTRLSNGSQIEVQGGTIPIPEYQLDQGPDGQLEIPEAPAAVLTGAKPADFEKLNAHLLSATFITVNAFLEAGGYTECQFTDDEQALLEEIWRPYLPKLPPWLSAVVGSAIVLTPKAVMFMRIREEKKKGDEHE